MGTLKPEIEITADGSVTLYRGDMDEHYHSVKGALAESRHVYIDLGWREFAASHQAVRVFEAGLGTGLNAALTARAALDAQVPTEYYGAELHPIAAELAELLAGKQEEEYLSEFRAVNEAEWNTAVRINPFFTLRKIEADLLAMRMPERIDVVYFDAFAPEKQPEMWGEQIFRAIYRSMTAGGILTTYCAKGAVRRMLQSVGFLTERLPGPANGKREVLRARKPL